MILHVETGGRSRVVEVRRTDGRFVVVLDGREHAADVNELNGHWSLLIGPLEKVAQAGASLSRPARSYEVAFVDGPDGAMMVHVDGRPVPVSVAPLRPVWGARGRDGARRGIEPGPGRIAAPIPGKVVKVLVKRGDTVEARQGVVIVEAMKMENELRSPKAGTVSDVRVKEGDSVDAGAILVVVE